MTRTVRVDLPPGQALASLRAIARQARWAVVRDEAGQLELWAEGALTAVRASCTVKATAAEDGGEAAVTLVGSASWLQLMAKTRIRKHIDELASALADPSNYPPAVVKRTAEQRLVAVLTLTLVIGAIFLALLVPKPTKETKAGKEVVALPSVALGSEVVYRGEIALVALYGGLLFLVPLFRGAGRGDLPIEVSPKGAKYEQVGETVTEVADKVEELEKRLNKMGIELALQAAGDSESPTGTDPSTS